MSVENTKKAVNRKGFDSLVYNLSEKYYTEHSIYYYIIWCVRIWSRLVTHRGIEPLLPP